MGRIMGAEWPTIEWRARRYRPVGTERSRELRSSRKLDVEEEVDIESLANYTGLR